MHLDLFSRSAPKEDLRNPTQSRPSGDQSFNSPHHGTFCLVWPARGCSRVETVLHAVPGHHGASPSSGTLNASEASFLMTISIRSVLFPSPEGTISLMPVRIASFYCAKPFLWPTATLRPLLSRSCKAAWVDLAHQCPPQLALVTRFYQ